MHIVQKLPQRVAFAVETLSRIENEYDFLNRIIFSDEASFHVSSKVNISTTAEFGAQKSPCSTHLQPTVIFQQDAETRMFQHSVGTVLPAGYPQGY
ncbi:hypothetical protein AVEN_151538-1 [Araneus ventricosus]|uniref:Uncharacterized protein n=1 Tax=Araneus ventricosus TaxID=182803 RepID=A0A4Y2N246_ARAVE|nr:hypothetical protein AVEN_78993-1 [Araneus ventricosus]GBN33469.1 hypothetical protein AVEN_151538-1 [Araneus ventricosus]